MRLTEITKTPKQIAIEFIRKLDRRAFTDSTAEDKYTITDAGIIHANCNIEIHPDLFVDGKLPVKFGRVDGNFLIIPDVLNAHLVRSGIGFPDKVTGDFIARHISATSMEGFPKEVYKSFDIRNSRIESLDHLPKIGHDILIGETQIDSLEQLPKLIDGSLNINLSRVHSLIGIADILEEVDGVITINAKAITEGGLGLLSIEKCHLVVTAGQPTPEWLRIIQKHMVNESNVDIFQCQSDLIQAGFEEHAQL